MRNGIANALVRIAYPRGSVRRVLIGPGRGLRFRVQPSMGATYALGFDSHHANWLSNKIKPGMIVYDVGANIAQLSLLFSRWVGPTGKVVALEPVSANVQILRDNIKLNNVTNIEVIPAAASETEGTASFLLNPRERSMGKLENCEPTYNECCVRSERFDVPTLRIDDLVAKHGVPNFLKIDVEGGARGVLAGAKNLLKTHGPGVYIELHGPDEQSAIRDILIPMGYQLMSLDGQVVSDPVATPCNPIWCERK